MSCIAPLALPHYAQKGISLLNGKWKIPAGTTVLPNLFHIVNNPKEFPNPDQFIPDRFLDLNGKYVKNDHNIVFSIGKQRSLFSTYYYFNVLIFESIIFVNKTAKQFYYIHFGGFIWKGLFNRRNPIHKVSNNDKFQFLKKFHSPHKLPFAKCE